MNFNGNQNQNFIINNNQINQNNLNFIVNFSMNNQMNQNNIINSQKDQMNMMDNQINHIIAMNLMNCQINLNNQMKNGLNHNCHDNIIEGEDIYSYILEEKKYIIFIRNDNTKIRMKIPISLRKNELYYTANLYKLNRYSDIILKYKNENLNEDESPIDDIIDGDEINIIETLEEIDINYYQNYLKLYNNENLINITFETMKGNLKNLALSRDTKIKEMIKIYLFENKIPEKYKSDFFFMVNAETLDNNDNSTLYEKKISSSSRIIVMERGIQNKNIIKGKKLKASIKNKNKIILTCNIGTLNQIKDFYNYLKSDLLKSENDKIKKIKIDKIELKEDEGRTISSIGKREDFDCEIEFYKRKEEISCMCILS